MREAIWRGGATAPETVHEGAQRVDGVVGHGGGRQRLPHLLHAGAVTHPRARVVAHHPLRPRHEARQPRRQLRQGHKPLQPPPADRLALEDPHCTAARSYPS